jgi:hypothetical protein
MPVTEFMSRSRFVGSQAELSVVWEPRRGLEMKAWYVRFAVSDALRRSGARSTEFLAASIATKF